MPIPVDVFVCNTSFASRLENMFGGDTFATAGNSSTYLPRPSRLSVILKLEIYVPGGALS